MTRGSLRYINSRRKSSWHFITLLPPGSLAITHPSSLQPTNTFHLHSLRLKRRSCTPLYFSDPHISLLSNPSRMSCIPHTPPPPHHYACHTVSSQLPPLYHFPTERESGADMVLPQPEPSPRASPTVVSDGRRDAIVTQWH
ncbi:hypothetical protein E2C01_054563 [Portunus trituberculatus]|uniref:Uncharacterized protein n=1 Tax=Portunus trituberculatus TaxID=210409 RepID=A0A5B7GSB2_PORTR|nr:hypothetical protein [Portunus trituberculatus]